MRTGEDTGPCPACGEPRGGRYEHDGRWVCWPCLPARTRRRPPQRRREPDRYGEVVDHVRRRLEEITDSTVFGIAPGVIAAHCPVCIDGTVRIRFIANPRPGIVVGDSDLEPDPEYSDEFNQEVDRMLLALEPGGHCSRGCTEADIAEALQ